jgi:hypothetical protein
LIADAELFDEIGAILRAGLEVAAARLDELPAAA